MIISVNNILAHLRDTKSIEKALHHSFNQLQAQNPRDTFYSFGIFTSGELMSIGITANSLEGLDSKVAEYQFIPSFRNYSHDALINLLKWEPGDWQFHYQVKNNELDAVSKELHKIYLLSDKIYDAYKDFGKAHRIVEKKINSKLIKLFIEALQSFQREADVENEITCGIWMGDQSESARQKLITQINNSKLAESYRADKRKR